MNYVPDTNISLHFLRGDLLAPLPTGTYFLSAITEIELFAKPNLSVSEVADIQTYLATVSVVQLPPDIRSEAARIRIAIGLKLPDAIIAATTLTLGATLLSNDRQLSRVPGLEVVALPLKS